MKIFKSLCLLAFLAGCQVNHAAAQGTNITLGGTNQTGLPIPASTNSPIITLGTDLLNFLYDNQAYFPGSSMRLDCLAFETGNHYGGIVDSHFALTTNGQISAGLAIGYINKTFYDAALNINMGMTLHPLATFGATNFAVYTWIESGPYLNLSTHNPGAQSFAGVTWNTKLGAGNLALTGMAGNISEFAKPCYGGGVSYGFKF